MELDSRPQRRLPATYKSRRREIAGAAGQASTNESGSWRPSQISLAGTKRIAGVVLVTQQVSALMAGDPRLWRPPRPNSPIFDGGRFMGRYLHALSGLVANRSAQDLLFAWTRRSLLCPSARALK